MSSISGQVDDAGGSAAPGRIVRAYRRDTGAFLSQTRTSDGVVADPHFNNVSLLLHLNSNYADSSQRPKTLIASGAPQVKNSEFQFGAGSLHMNGTGYLSSAGNIDFVFGSGDFCIELWVKTTTTLEKMLVDQYTTGLDTWQFGVRNGVLSWYHRSSGIGAYALTGQIRVDDNKWHHVVASREAGTLRFFVDGVLDKQASVPTNYTHMLVLGIGAQVASRNANYDFVGQIDEVRVTKGNARYTATFSPATEQFPNSATPPPIGTYELDTGLYAGDVNVVCLDDNAGEIHNDLILRVTPI